MNRTSSSSRHPRPLTRAEDGFTLVDVLTAVALLSLAAVGIAYSSVTASHTLGKVRRSAAAAQFAYNKLEELLLINPARLDDRLDSVELGLKAEGIHYVREVDVTVNDDGTRSVTVRVHPANEVHDEETVVTHTIAEWGAK